MGTAASAGLSAAIKESPSDEIEKVIKVLPPESLEKLKVLLRQDDGSQGTLMASCSAAAESLLASSLEAARAAGLGTVPAEGSDATGDKAVKAKQWIPFEEQIPVTNREQAFHVIDHVFLGSEFGAANRELLDGLGITKVVNVTAGSGRVPNFFEDSGIEYLHFELFDQPGSDPTEAAREGGAAMQRWRDEGCRVLVHCSAGLSRSVTVVLAWLMEAKGYSLAEAVELTTERRGRRLQCNPSFWCFLAALERKLRGRGPGTPPSFDFTRWIVEDVTKMGFAEEKVREALQGPADWVNFEAIIEHVLA